MNEQAKVRRPREALNGKLGNYRASVYKVLKIKLNYIAHYKYTLFQTLSKDVFS